MPGVADLVVQTQQDIVFAAYLHDVIKDCEITPEDPKQIYFSDNKIDAALLLSKNHDLTTFKANCERIKANSLARAV